MFRLFLALATVLWLAALPAHADRFDSAGVKIRYSDRGHGEAVVLIHGLHSSARMNWGMPGISGNLAERYRVIALDCRGHGQSGKPTAAGSYGVQMVEDVVSLLDHLHLPSAHLVGYSMGGMIALKVAALHPGRVRSVTLGGMGWFPEGSRAQAIWAESGQRDDAEGIPALLNGFAEFALTAGQVRSIKAPIAVVVGERDPARRLYIAPLCRLRPGTPVRLVAGAGHVSCVTAPEFRTAIRATLDQITKDH